MPRKIHPEQELLYALVAEGTSDQVLIPIIDWIFEQHNVIATCAQFTSTGSLVEKIQFALKVSQLDALLIHRDADTDPKDREQLMQRREEIAKAVELSGNCPPCVPIIPIQTTEAWLLFNEEALRKAVGNPNNKPKLKLPSLKTVENLADPKQTLFDLLKTARLPETKRKRKKTYRQRFDARQAVVLHIDDFSQLRQLSAFQALEQDLCETLGLEPWGR